MSWVLEEVQGAKQAVNGEIEAQRNLNLRSALQ
jgi:hypothetical protein